MVQVRGYDIHGGYVAAAFIRNKISETQLASTHDHILYSAHLTIFIAP